MPLFRASENSDFYPRPPRGGRRTNPTPKSVAECISIYALREEGDELQTAAQPSCSNFYPRPPRGGRRPAQKADPQAENFYPRPPRGGRRTEDFQPGGCFVISIHALREEGDGISMLLWFPVKLFLSTPSARRATRGCTGGCGPILFLSTPSARRATVFASAM